MEAQLSEANTFPAQSFANSFFTVYPTDTRYYSLCHNVLCLYA